MHTRMSIFRGLALAGGLVLAACSGSIPANPNPPVPALQPDPMPNPPVTATPLIWQPGHWDWSGADYVWRPGEYVPSEGHSNQWMPGFWSYTSGGWVWQPAHWL